MVQRHPRHPPRESETTELDETSVEPRLEAHLDDDINVATNVVLTPGLQRRGFARLPPGTRVGRYIVLDEVGHGAMASVYGAYDPQLDRRVALKLLPAGGSRVESPEAATARLQREARALAKLSHPNVVPVYDVGAFADQVFIAMEMVDGVTVREWFGARRSHQEVVATLIEAGRGLAAAHAAHLVHRDFKPSNVIIGNDGRVRVLDFGLARRLHGPRVDVTQHGAVAGTPGYIAPEVAMGADASERSDQYSFCVVFYEALYSALPPRAGVATVRADPPRGSGVPTWLHRVVRRGLSVDPRERYPSMDAMLAELGAERKSKGKRLLTAAGLVGIVGAAIAVPVLAARDKSPGPCEAADDELAGVWNDETRAAVRNAFGATKSPLAESTFARLDAELADYASRWTAARVDACEATNVKHMQSPALLDLRVACLDKRRARLQGLVDLFRTQASSAVVERALDVAADLPAVSFCSDTEAIRWSIPPPEDAETRDKVAALRARIARASAQHDARVELSSALEDVRVLADEARAIDYPPLTTDVLLLLGQLEGTSSASTAESTLYEASRQAAAARNAVAAAKVWLEIVDLMRIQARYKEALIAARGADLAIIRAGEADVLRADYWYSVGTVVMKQGKYDDARAHYEKALAGYRTADKPLRIAHALNGLGIASQYRGRPAEASAYYDEAVAIYHEALGPKHPRVAGMLVNLGGLSLMTGDYDKSISRSARALEILELAGEGNQAEMVQALNNLGNASFALSRWADSRRHFERGIALAVKVHGNDHPETGRLLGSMSHMLVTNSQFDEAREPAERALAAMTAALGREHPQLAFPLRTLAIVASERGRHAEALAYAKRGLAIRRKALGLDHPLVADNLRTLARVERRRGRLERACKHLSRVGALLDRQTPQDPTSLAAAWAETGECLIDARQAKAAVDALERAVSLGATSKAPQLSIARYSFALARALEARDKKRSKRTIKLAKLAALVYEAAGDEHKDALAEVEVWLENDKPARRRRRRR